MNADASWVIIGSTVPGVATVTDGQSVRTAPITGMNPSHETCSSGYAAWVKKYLLSMPVDLDSDGSISSESARAAMVRSGFAVSITDKSLLGYMDEAAASRAGEWDCVSRTALFDAIAKSKDIHADILYGIAMNESQRDGKPWPWTINVFGRGYYFDDRTEAWRAAKWLVDHGYTSFDIGIMQVNWKYHGSRFTSLWDAFQPSNNIRAAADIVLENYKLTGNWADAVTWYHNRKDRERGQAYFARFVKYFNTSVAQRDKIKEDKSQTRTNAGNQRQINVAFSG